MRTRSSSSTLSGPMANDTPTAGASKRPNSPNAAETDEPPRKRHRGSEAADEVDPHLRTPSIVTRRLRPRSASTRQVPPQDHSGPTKPAPLLNLPLELLYGVGECLEDRDLSNFARANRGLYVILNRELYLRGRGSKPLRWATDRTSLRRSLLGTVKRALDARGHARESVVPSSICLRTSWPLLNERLHFVRAVIRGDLAMISYFLDRDPSMIRPSFCQACNSSSCPQPEVSPWPEDYNCPLGKSDCFDEPPLEIALTFRKSKAARLLIAKGADPRCLSTRQCTALHFAAENNLWGLVECLVNEYGLDVNGVNFHGMTALDIACTRAQLPRNPHMIKKLISLGASINHGFPYHGAIHYPVGPYRPGRVYRSTPLAAMVMGSDHYDYGSSRLLRGIGNPRSNRMVHVDVLLQHGARFDMKYDQDKFMRDSVVRVDHNLRRIEGYAELFRVLLQADVGRQSLLLQCVQLEQTEAALAILNDDRKYIKGWKRHADDQGTTALHAACRMGPGNPVLVRMLELGADLNRRRNKRGLTPADMMAEAQALRLNSAAPAANDGASSGQAAPVAVQNGAGMLAST
ncbi:ankyrin repeat-containing domain protein [Podospora appendiculata]|uniref:Ankyrin repeat-containing domain protein n=1 Tax=Podospora appendiculata TaxID=314037 RepID=A0AAE0XAX7_9PEZI|nr:ankyrin repeat-containing domain protein [Podospora appendiculata]